MPPTPPFLPIKAANHRRKKVVNVGKEREREGERERETETETEKEKERRREVTGREIT